MSVADVGLTVTGSMAAAATAIAAYTFQDAEFRAVDTWLSDTGTPAGAARHIVAMLGAQQLSVLQAPLVGPRNKANNYVQYFESQFNISPEQASYVNMIQDLTGQPNIEGIVIFTESETTSRQVDVSEQPMVVQDNTNSQAYVIDNAVPKPRTWSLKGYLTVVLPTDQYLVVKPSILLQRNYLDACAKTRKPVWFKTWDNTFVRVLITNIDTAWDPKSLNTMQINLNLKEFVAMEVSTVPSLRQIATLVEQGAA